MARCTWALSDEEIVDRMRENGQTSAKHWLFDLYDTLNHGKFTKMAVTLWAIWFARRKAIHENIFQSPQQTSSFVNSYLQELQTIPKQSRQASIIVSQSATAPRWLPSEEGVAKINVDGAISGDGNVGVAAAICRDHTGEYLGSSAVVFRGITDPLILEVFACREAMALAEDLNIHRLRIANDCQGVIADINSGSRGPHATILHEISERKSLFLSCNFVFERRNFNFEANDLAKFASSLSVMDFDYVIWSLRQADAVVPIGKNRLA
ncbi:uncharacterized protein [Aegilops tauschii subsp. strangulata]|uniref:uncharacterized protein n=1 Tax=Aegilops tauschii subsp. strangulata TaxID=200361 RepID=UPI003CC87A2C